MKNFLRLTSFFLILSLTLHKQFICKGQVTQCIRKCPEAFFLQKCGTHLKAALKTIVIPLSTVFTRISAAALITPNAALIRVITVICNFRVYYIQDKMLSHLGLYYIQGRLLHLGLLHESPYYSNTLALKLAIDKDIGNG